MRYMLAMLNNPALQSAVLAWFVAQVLKGFINLFMHRKLDWKRFVGMGGMPSSHTAFVCALATSAGILNGFDSTIFALALGFALVVMVDAAGVRRAAGLQAKALNIIIQHLKTDGMAAITQRELKELLGHTPVQVFAGSLLGVLVAFVRFR